MRRLALLAAPRGARPSRRRRARSPTRSTGSARRPRSARATTRRWARAGWGPCARSSVGRRRTRAATATTCGRASTRWSQAPRASASACCPSSTARHAGSPAASTTASCGIVRRLRAAPPSRARCVGGVRRRRGRPLRTGRELLEREPAAAASPDPRLADLERAELRDLLRAEAVGEGLREAAARGVEGDPLPRPQGRRRPRRDGGAGRARARRSPATSSSEISTTAAAPSATSTGSPSTRTARRRRAVESQAELFRDESRDAHDSNAGLWVTETGWGSSTGRTRSRSGRSGQADRLGDVYRLFAQARNRLNVKTVVWFSWRDSPVSICAWCANSGLLTKSG